MAFTRSVTSLVRSSRLAASSSRSNPVLKVLGHDRLVARQYATVFERNKPHVNIGTTFLELREACTDIDSGTIGHVDHGKVSQQIPMHRTPTNPGRPP